MAESSSRQRQRQDSIDYAQTRVRAAIPKHRQRKESNQTSRARAAVKDAKCKKLMVSTALARRVPLASSTRFMIRVAGPPFTPKAMSSSFVMQS
eukprot:3329494-Rhodomonas_salina.1